MMPEGPIQPISRDAIAMILAIGLATALNLITIAVLYDAIRDPARAGLSENATQILTGWGGGIIGILGAVFGYRAAAQHTADHERQADAQADDRAAELADDGAE